MGDKIFVCEDEECVKPLCSCRKEVVLGDMAIQLCELEEDNICRYRKPHVFIIVPAVK